MTASIVVTTTKVAFLSQLCFPSTKSVRADLASPFVLYERGNLIYRVLRVNFLSHTVIHSAHQTFGGPIEESLFYFSFLLKRIKIYFKMFAKFKFIKLLPLLQTKKEVEKLC